MKNFKRVLTIFLVLICSVGLISCKKNNPSSSSNQSSQPTQSGESNQSDELDKSNSSNQLSASNLSSPELVLKEYFKAINSIDYEKALSLTNSDEVYEGDFDKIIEEYILRAKNLSPEIKEVLKYTRVTNIQRINESEDSVTLSFEFILDKEYKGEIPDDEIIMDAVFIKQNDIWKIDIESGESKHFVNNTLP